VTLYRADGDGIDFAVDSKGAQLMSLAKSGTEYLWQGDPTWWPRRAPVLFPIVGNIRNDRAHSAQGDVTLKRHGLARNLEFTPLDASKGALALRLDSSEESRAAYPYDFRLTMTYRASDGRLTQTFEVENTGDVTLPFVLGGHPAFNVPVTKDGGESFSDYRLEFSCPWTYASPRIDTSTGLLDFQDRFELLRDASTLPLTHRTFDVDTLVFEDVPDRTVRLVGPSGRGMQVDFDGFDYLGVWSAAHDAPFVALEPWTGCATATDEDDEFEHKRGMTLLPAGEKFVRSFSLMPL
jgi:galactose mutarotase-like enzyme